MDNAGEGILLANVSGNILEANKKMLELLVRFLNEAHSFEIYPDPPLGGGPANSGSL